MSERPSWWPKNDKDIPQYMAQLRETRGYSQEWDAGVEAGVKAIMQEIERRHGWLHADNSISVAVLSDDWAKLREECEMALGS